MKTVLHSHCPCGADAAAAADPTRRISTHRSSQGWVIYFRCSCGHPQVAVIRWQRGSTSSAIA